MEKIRNDEKNHPELYTNAEYMITSFEKTVLIDGSIDSITDGKYANHSCEPNCEFVTEVLEGKDGKMAGVIFDQIIENLILFEEINMK